MKKVLIAAAVLATLTACEYQEFYKVPTMPGNEVSIQNPTRLTVTTDASSTVTEGINVTLLSPETNKVQASFGTDNAVDVEAGTYIILKTNDPWEGVTFDAPIVTLNTFDSRAEGPFVSSADNIHAGFKVVTLNANEYNEYEMALNQYTRTIRFMVKLVGITADEIASVTYDLTGARISSNLIKPFGPDASTGMATLTGQFPALETDADGNLTAASDARLLGLDLTAPQLTITARLADGSVQTLTLVVTSLLHRFYQMNADQFITLEALLSFGLDGLTGSIQGWTPGWDEDITGK